jgi:hypothetical protein
VKLKGIDGGPHKRWSMWFNSMQREEPYQGFYLFSFRKLKFGEVEIGGAWLSPARVVRCWVNSLNERNPCLVSCYGFLRRLPMRNRRKVRMTSSQYAPYVLGYTRATMVKTKSRLLVKDKKTKIILFILVRANLQT